MVATNTYGMDFTPTDDQGFTFRRFKLQHFTRKVVITDSARLIFIEKGTARLKVNDMEYSVDDHDFLFLFPRTSVQLIAERHCEVCVIGYFMLLQESVTMHISPNFFIGLMYQTKWTMGEEDLRAARGFCELFEYNIRHGVEEIEANVASTLFSLFIQMFYQKLKGLLPDESKGITILNRSLWWRFIEMVSQKYKEEHNVAYYAEQLCVSTKYLTQIVRRIASTTPKSIINRRIAGESAYLLARTKDSIQEISLRLGFSDQSYFGRFFKRTFGLSPHSFRVKPDLNVLTRINTHFSGDSEEEEN